MSIDEESIVLKPLYHPSFLRPVDRTAIGYGYGIALAPLQAAVVANGIIDHGLMTPPTLLRRDSAAAAQQTRIVSERTSAEMRGLLRNAVRDGTGRQADVPGFAVGGKTGTTLKSIAGEYAKTRRVTWFFAGFPMNDTPRYTLLVMLDEPQGTQATHDRATAEWNAVPTTGAMIQQLAPILDLAPVEPSSRSL